MKIFLKALKKSLAKPHTFVLCYFTTVQYCMERNGTVMLKIIDDFVWGVPLIVLILAVGIFLTIRLRGLQITKLPLAVRHIIANEKDGKDGEVSSFGALCTALSATIGTGNIVGVATAVVAGGPGALFWMWIAALFGTATKYAECLLAIKYRVVEADGHVVGGPFYYIENGMGRKFRWLGQIFAFFGVGVGLLGIGTFTQINGITGAVKGFFDLETACSVQLFGNTYSWSVVISGLILTVCVALVIIGGIKRISSVAQVVVPFMALVYVVTVLIILLTHLGEIPAALATIVQSAFGLRAAAGGTLGAILVAMQKGIARGIFSNEAGLGSAPIAAATAKTDEPVAQGLGIHDGNRDRYADYLYDDRIVHHHHGYVEHRSGRGGCHDESISDRASVPGTRLLVFADAVSGVFCIYNDPWLELLQREMSGISGGQPSRGVKMLSLAVYSGGIDRTVYDRVGSLDDCGYF